MAEAYWWQSQIHSARMQDASRRAAEQAAADHCLKQCLMAVDSSGEAWPRYQLCWADVASTPEESRRRARDVLELPESKADSAQRAQALSRIAVSYKKAGATPEQLHEQLNQGFTEYQRYLLWMPDVSKAKATDVHALLGLSEFILCSRVFWLTKSDLCHASAERALALADELHAPDMVARARAHLGTHAVNMATRPSRLDLAALHESADHYRAAVEFDDNLATAPLTAVERQGIRNSFAPAWRYALASVDGRLARTPGANSQALLKAGRKALDDAKDLPEVWKKLYADLRKKLISVR